MKSVVIYSYFKTEVADYNLDFFIKNEISYKSNIDYIIVINGFECSFEFPNLENLTIYKKENSGYDFGAHSYALEKIKDKKYDYYFFMNSGVFGPVLKKEYKNNHWTNIFINKINKKVKLVGTTIVCLPKTDGGGLGPKVEGFFFMTDKLGLGILQKQQTIFTNHRNKVRAILDGEYGLSKCILKNGYTIDCMIPEYQGIDWTNKVNWYKNSNKHPSRKNSFYGKSLNPYDMIFHKWYWKNMDKVNFDMIDEYKKSITP